MPITGGHLGQERKINLADRCNELLVKGNHLYTCDPDEREGTIQIDQFDMITGNKIRTLDTKLPWMVVDDDGDLIHRMMSNAHVVGNGVVFLITSVGSHINTIVTFALPPP